MTITEEIAQLNQIIKESKNRIKELQKSNSNSTNQAIMSLSIYEILKYICLKSDSYKQAAISFYGEEIKQVDNISYPILFTRGEYISYQDIKPFNIRYSQHAGDNSSCLFTYDFRGADYANVKIAIRQDNKKTLIDQRFFDSRYNSINKAEDAFSGKTITYFRAWDNDPYSAIMRTYSFIPCFKI